MNFKEILNGVVGGAGGRVGLLTDSLSFRSLKPAIGWIVSLGVALGGFAFLPAIAFAPTASLAALGIAFALFLVYGAIHRMKIGGHFLGLTFGSALAYGVIPLLFGFSFYASLAIGFLALVIDEFLSRRV